LEWVNNRLPLATPTFGCNEASEMPRLRSA
jgi:hypothetical protein